MNDRDSLAISIFKNMMTDDVRSYSTDHDLYVRHLMSAAYRAADENIRFERE